jgi:hypothetical protein
MLLFRDLATLRADADVLANVDDLHWTGPTPALEAMAKDLRAWRLPERAHALAAARATGEDADRLR